MGNFKKITGIIALSTVAMISSAYADIAESSNSKKLSVKELDASDYRFKERQDKFVNPQNTAQSIGNNSVVNFVNKGDHIEANTLRVRDFHRINHETVYKSHSSSKLGLYNAASGTKSSNGKHFYAFATYNTDGKHPELLDHKAKVNILPVKKGKGSGFDHPCTITTGKGSQFAIQTVHMDGKDMIAVVYMKRHLKGTLSFKLAYQLIDPDNGEITKPIEINKDFWKSNEAPMMITSGLTTVMHHGKPALYYMGYYKESPEAPAEEFTEVFDAKTGEILADRKKAINPITPAQSPDQFRVEGFQVSPRHGAGKEKTYPYALVEKMDPDGKTDLKLIHPVSGAVVAESEAYTSPGGILGNINVSSSSRTKNKDNESVKFFINETDIDSDGHKWGRYIQMNVNLGHKSYDDTKTFDSDHQAILKDKGDKIKTKNYILTVGKYYHRTVLYLKKNDGSGDIVWNSAKEDYFPSGRLDKVVLGDVIEIAFRYTAPKERHSSIPSHPGESDHHVVVGGKHGLAVYDGSDNLEWAALP